MRNSATNLFSLLENLLEWSRIKRGLTEFEPSWSLLVSCVEDSLKSIREPADKKGIQISCNIAESLNVYTDAYMIRSVIRNLVTNAIKFTPRGGMVTITGKTAPDHSVVIAIHDTGIGMNEKMTGNLFRLDEPTNRRGTEGEPTTGLDLLICKEFIEKHGGKLWVESEENKGSTFYFLLPGEVR